MRLLVCAIVAGCGGLELYEIPSAVAPVSGDQEQDVIVPWKGVDDPAGGISSVGEGAEGPMHVLSLADAVSPLVPELEAFLADADDLVIRLDMIDPPQLQVRIAALTQTGGQDYCLPTIDTTGGFDGRDFRFVLEGYDFQATALPWRRLVLEGALEAGSLVDLVLYAELPAQRMPFPNACDALTCQPCSVLPGVEHELCVHVPLELESAPLQGLVIEPVSLGDAAAACR